MTEGIQSANLAALEHSYKWFEYHAKQRLEMFKFFVLIGAGIFSVAGFSLQSRHDYLLSVSGLLLFFMSLLFWKIDMRSRELTECGEKAIVNYWNEIGLKSDFCPVLLAGHESRGQMRFRRAFGITFFWSGLIGVGLALAGLYR